MQALKSLFVASLTSASLIGGAFVGVSSAADSQLLHFTAKWCEPCRLMKPTIERLKSMGYPIRTLDIDQHSGLAERLQVRSVPAFVMVQNGKITQRADRALTFGSLQSMFSKAGISKLGDNPNLYGSQSRGEGRPLVRGQSPNALNALTSAIGSLGRKNNKRPRLLDEEAQIADASSGRSATRSSSQLNSVAPRPGGSARTDAQARAMAAAIRLRIEDSRGQSFGSGTVIDVHGKEVLALTCAHIFRESQGKGRILIDTFDSQGTSTVRGQLIGHDFDRDVALVSFRPRTTIEPVPVAANMSRLQEGSQLFSIGCNKGDDPTIMQGRLKAIDRYMGAGNFVVSGEPIDGRSGGGLFDNQGQLVGVCNAADPQANEGIYASLKEVHHQLDQKGLSFVYRGDRQPQLAQAETARQPRRAPPMIDHTSMETDFAPQNAGTSRTDREPSSDDDTEVVVVIRSRKDPSARSKVLVVDRPTHQLLDRLNQEARR